MADFRDPWTNIDFYHSLKLSKSSDRKHRALEQEVVSSADLVAVVGKSMQEEYLEYSGNVKVIKMCIIHICTTFTTLHVFDSVFLYVYYMRFLPIHHTITLIYPYFHPSIFFPSLLS